MFELIRKNFREKLFNNKQVVQAVGAHDALGARLIEKFEFDAIWASGLEISASQAKPDANILTMTEFLDAAKKMAYSTSLPIIADCDTGFGDLNNVIRTVQEYENAGIAAICIEDKKFPKTNSFVPGRQKLEDINTFCEKIVAAQNAKKDPNFLIIARIESLIAGEGMEAALERANAYKAAGADVILIHSKKSTPAEIFTFSNSWQGGLPLVVVPTTYPNVSIKELEQNNISMTIYANQGLRASIKAVEQMLKTLKISGNLNDIDEYLCDVKDIFEVQGMNDMIANEKFIKQKVDSLFSIV
ncbi:isocitrate lyase/phosphoenolpyruvate mutase family protein [Priestia flexa]|uniref:isocitrate lyase/phosphoenolpyruvate mutase family protein n=1 Tax=Priestia flexa TaxID=86664 RepID=UPI00077C6B6E|nr:isocitrate lyase/phosphoenolpyruvate mutase family protein [Priestia flexa]MED4590501.1 isocitrate lyase/phosphoenolpyruvate mutase family protein [Priestia flexa]